MFWNRWHINTYCQRKGDYEVKEKEVKPAAQGWLPLQVSDKERRLHLSGMRKVSKDIFERDKRTLIPFSPFIYSVNFSPCRKHLADSSVPCSPGCIPSRVYSTDIYSTSFPFALLNGEMWAMLLFPRCVPSWACLPTSAVGWAQTGRSANLGDWTKMRQLMLLVLKPSSPLFGGCCHPWGSDV